MHTGSTNTHLVGVQGATRGGIKEEGTASKNHGNLGRRGIDHGLLGDSQMEKYLSNELNCQ